MGSDIHTNDADEAVIEALRGGRNLPANIAEETGYSRQYLNQRLRRLEEHGIVENRGHGLYELVESET